jgi:hypothetical protein
MTVTLDCSIVIPTIGRESLLRLLAALDEESEVKPAEIIVVDDRSNPSGDLMLDSRFPLVVLRSGGRKPVGRLPRR